MEPPNFVGNPSICSPNWPGGLRCSRVLPPIWSPEVLRSAWRIRRTLDERAHQRALRKVADSTKNFTNDNRRAPDCSQNGNGSFEETSHMVLHENPTQTVPPQTNLQVPTVFLDWDDTLCPTTWLQSVKTPGSFLDSWVESLDVRMAAYRRRYGHDRSLNNNSTQTCARVESAECSTASSQPKSTHSTEGHSNVNRGDPSSASFPYSSTAHSLSCLPVLEKETRELLEACQEAAVKFIEALILLVGPSAITVVTNADKQWLLLACTRLLPRVWELLQKHQVPIISARERFANRVKAGPAAPTAWKRLTFREELDRKHREILAQAAAAAGGTGRPMHGGPPSPCTSVVSSSSTACPEGSQEGEGEGGDDGVRSQSHIRTRDGTINGTGGGASGPACSSTALYREGGASPFSFRVVSVGDSLCDTESLLELASSSSPACRSDEAEDEDDTTACIGNAVTLKLLSRPSVLALISQLQRLSSSCGTIFFSHGGVTSFSVEEEDRQIAERDGEAVLEEWLGCPESRLFFLEGEGEECSEDEEGEEEQVGDEFGATEEGEDGDTDMEGDETASRDGNEGGAVLGGTHVLASSPYVCAATQIGIGESQGDDWPFEPRRLHLWPSRQRGPFRRGRGKGLKSVGQGEGKSFRSSKIHTTFRTVKRSQNLEEKGYKSVDSGVSLFSSSHAPPDCLAPFCSVGYSSVRRSRLSREFGKEKERSSDPPLPTLDPYSCLSIQVPVRRRNFGFLGGRKRLS
uniref:Uncharacterized protein n=1 Tax=Chromera velia CCMP2878 TaxID=1169474 RepID=A0A0G4HEC6_9ALVE|eukprot:Cvel_26739.t1-p1 / transcript=Cvel_26739.t1 / gene=Cvel_26739 / organism=Chromera_velia_CCMP2878 / gene_product=hypothetical protein / transcript_product=hypothetical protein / location=Cvel_scaffold3228:694-4935(+) / protein_length=746 / sequence_SO=supercontig / SO=protein_coding / is_pseudo=false